MESELATILALKAYDDEPPEGGFHIVWFASLKLNGGTASFLKWMDLQQARTLIGGERCDPLELVDIVTCQSENEAEQDARTADRLKSPMHRLEGAWRSPKTVVRLRDSVEANYDEHPVVVLAVRA